MSTRRQRHEQLCKEQLSEEERLALAKHREAYRWALERLKFHHGEITKLEVLAMDRAKGKAERNNGTY